MDSHPARLKCEDEQGDLSDMAPWSPWPEAPAALLQWLQSSRGDVIREWVDRLTRMSPSYERRSREELAGTVSEAYAANVEALAEGNLERIDRFIDFITEIRLQAGFPLSDVQKAFELFRFILLRRLREEGQIELLSESVEPVNACLSYTIHRFSDYFQHMHEKSIRRHAQSLEKQIADRTAELAESERKYKTLVEEITDGYFVIKEEHIVFANEAFCQMHGATLDEVIGQPFLRFVASDCRQRVLARYHQALARKPLVGQLEYTRLGCPPDKAATEIKARVINLGEGPLIIGICRDISERVAMEAKVRDHERMAYVGHLTASLSHEIRNPLSSITLNLQILSRRLELDGFDRRRLEITVKEVSRLEGILRQLLDTARPLTIKPALTDLAAIVRGCVDLMEPKAAEKDLEIVERHPRNLPLARLDTGKVEQAIINLFLNAFEASPDGARIHVWTKASRSRTNRTVEVGVRDSGPGISHDEKEHLFTPFYTSKSHGTGLGLSNVKRILDAHGGEVAVRSRKGRGATFVMRFPCSR